MDKGEKEESMRRGIQDEVKLRARRRRHKVHLQKALQGMDEGDLYPAHVHIPTEPSNAQAESGASMSLAKDTPNATDGQLQNIGSLSHLRLSDDQPGVADPFHALGKELELSTIMSYMDCVLPTAFPMYRPSLLRGGRGWLLAHIMKNEALRHIIVSISTHFFSVVPVLESPERKICESWALREFSNRAIQAIGRVRQDIGDPGNWHAVAGGSGVLSKVHLLESVVHLMLLEVFGTHSSQWEMHLDAAIMLFRQILDEQAANVPHCHATDIFESVFRHIGLGQFSTDTSSSDYSPWNADQASYHFSASILVAADIIASISFQKTPRLRNLHSMLLPDETTASRLFLQLEDIFGCSSCVFLTLSKIAELDGWKRNQKQIGDFSITQLAQRGAAIEQQLGRNLADCSTTFDKSTSQDHPEGTDSIRYLDGAMGRKSPNCEILSHIWILAARIYLHVVLSGWQPLASVMVVTFDEAIGLLHSAPTHTLSALAWPFCVIGSMANPAQESIFRELYELIGPTARFGTMNVAMCVLEEVWRHRDDTEKPSWDLAVCLRALGHRVMLI